MGKSSLKVNWYIIFNNFVNSKKKLNKQLTMLKSTKLKF